MLALALLAQLATAPSTQAVRTDTPPVLDGRLDDPAWQRSLPQTSFTQKFPNERAAPSERTSFRILYDDDAIYVGIECDQRGTPIVHRLTRRDRVVEADRVAVTIDSRGDGASAYEFSVNASGVLADSIRFNDVQVDPDWDETWDARAVDTADGWSVEMKIPLRVLRFSETDQTAWRLQVRRYVSLLQETDEWAFIPRAGAGEISRYGHLEGVRPNAANAGGFEFRPFVLGRVDRRDPGSGTLGSGTAATGSAGFDAKWHARRDLTLDLSVNPDFAQVDADRLILNLTNYEVELPEKRPFFLEGRDVFTTQLPLFYSRRIGRVAPGTPALLPGEALVDPTRPAALLGAQKLVGRIADRTSIGALSAVTERNDVDVRDRAGRERASPAEARTLFNVLRLKREVGSNGHIGLMATSVSRGEDTGAYVRDAARATSPREAVLCPDGTRIAEGQRCFHDAYVGAADGRWRSESGDWTASGMVLGSYLRDGPPRRLRDGTVIGPGATGLGGIARVAKEGGVPWVGEVEYETEGRRLDFNDAGYMRRQNQRALTAILEYRTLAPWFVTVETHTQAEFFARRNLDGLLLDEAYKLRTQWKFENFWNVMIEGHYRRTYFDDREIGDGTALERGAMVGTEYELKSDPRRRVNAEFTGTADAVFDGFLFQTTGLVTFRALPQLDISLGPDVTYAAGEPRFAGRTPGALVFGKLEAGNISTTLRTTYTFTPRITLQTYAQLFLAAGHYSDFGVVSDADAGAGRVVRRAALLATPAPSENPDFRDAALNLNIVLRWEYLLGSSLFFVYTRTQAPTIQLQPGQRGVLDATGLGRAPATDTILLKLAHFFG